MRRVIRLTAVLLTLALSLALAACGGGQQQTATPSTPQPAAPEQSASPAPAPAASGEAEPAGELTFGFAVAKTGRFSAEGTHTAQGYEMWADEVNARGGLKVGDKTYKVKLLGLDTQSDTNNAVKLYERLIQQDKVDFLLSPWGSGDNFAVSVVTERAGYPLLMSSGSANNIFDRGFKNIFQVSVAASQIGEPMADYLLQNKDIKTIAVAYENFLFSQQKHDFFMKKIEGSHLQVVVDEQYPLAAQEFSSLVSKMKAHNPDAVILFNIMPSVIYFTNQMTELGLKPKLYFSSISLQFDAFREGVGNAVDGMMEGGFFHRDLTEGAGKFWDDYEARYKTTGNTDAAYGYIAAQILGQAIEKAGTTDLAKVIETIRTGTWETIGGTYTYDDKGMNPNLPAFVVQWLNGKRTIVWPKSLATADPVYPRP